MRFHTLLVTGLLLAFSLACSASNSEESANTGASSEIGSRSYAGEITATNVYDHEAAWPSIVALEESWRPPSAEKALKASYRGAVVRVERDGRVRIDFGRHGQHDVPIERTDLVQRANEVRAGTRHKAAPVFVLQMGTRLVDPLQEAPGALPSFFLAEAEVILALFADPTADGFRELAATVAELDALDGVVAILFPQGLAGVELAAAHTQLRRLDWRAPYAYPRLTPDHTRSLLGVDETPPYALALTPEGRVLFRSSLGDPTAFAGLRAALRG